MTPFNIHEMRDLVSRSIERGPSEWPGIFITVTVTVAIHCKKI